MLGGLISKNKTEKSENGLLNSLMPILKMAMPTVVNELKKGEIKSFVIALDEKEELKVEQKKYNANEMIKNLYAELKTANEKIKYIEHANEKLKDCLKIEGYEVFDNPFDISKLYFNPNEK